MKVLIIAGFSESIVAFRGALIRDLVAAGCEVHVGAPGLRSQVGVGSALGLADRNLHDIPLRRAGTNPFVDLGALVAIWRLMRVLRPDVSLPYTIKPVIYGSLAAWLAGVPKRFALITGLGYAFTGGRKGLIVRLVNILYRLALARLHKVFFQNPDDESLFRESAVLPAGVPSVIVNGSGVDLVAYPFQAQGLARNPTYLMIGRLIGDKGVREYANAARRIKARFAAARFQLAGWIDENPDAIAQSELDTWIAEGTIEFLGRLIDVRPAIAASTVYVLPSYREGTPRTVLESMAIGRPVITTDSPGCRETVIHGENGYLVEVKSVDALAAAMERFIDDPSLAVGMGQCSRKIAEDKYDVRKVNAVMLREMGISNPDACKETPL